MTTPPQDRATIDVIAGEIAAQFGETEVEPKRQFKRAVRILGALSLRTMEDAGSTCGCRQYDAR